MIRLVVALSALLLTHPASAEIDYVEVWHACDDAAADEGFAEASIPSEEIQGSKVKQVAGRWEGKTLLIVTAMTSTGQVFCMADAGPRVVHYKLDGRTIIERD